MRGATEEVDGRMHIPSRMCGLARRREPLGGPLTDDGVGSSQLRAIAVRPLQVISDDLVRRVVTELRIEPLGVCLVEKSTHPLGISSYAASRMRA